MNTLESFGWNIFHQQYYTQNARNDFSVGRVTSIKGFKYSLITPQGEVDTELSGKLLYGADTEDLPKVGDWVSCIDYGATGYIISVFPRMNELSRKHPGTKTQKQVLAANIDFAVIVQGLDRDFNLMRLDRYLVQLAACAINPIVVLNKADLQENPEAYKEKVLKLKRDCPVYLCSTYSGFGLEELMDNVFQKGKTYILIGSSGVGKSSLLNALISSNIQKTGSISEVTLKGKHTTSTRDLFQLPNGSLIIDTPGMREFGVTLEGETSAGLFPEIEKFAMQCRFADCQHVNEAGCAVMEAVHQRKLDSILYDSYLKLMKERQRFEIDIEDKKRLAKQAGRMSREAKNYRKKYKF